MCYYRCFCWHLTRLPDKSKRFLWYESSSSSSPSPLLLLAAVALITVHEVVVCCYYRNELSGLPVEFGAGFCDTKGAWTVKVQWRKLGCVCGDQ